VGVGLAERMLEGGPGPPSNVRRVESSTAIDVRRGITTGCGRRFGGGLCIAHADGTNLRALVSGPQLFGPKWSPDGTRIAYNDQADGPTRNKVFVVDVATGETTFVADGFFDDWLDVHTLIIESVPQ
jgi:hypothetical protein